MNYNIAICDDCEAFVHCQSHADKPCHKDSDKACRRYGDTAAAGINYVNYRLPFLQPSFIMV